MTMRIGNVPTSILKDTDNLIFAEGEAPRKYAYGEVKKDLLGTESLKTTAQTIKGAINENITQLSNIEQDNIKLQINDFSMGYKGLSIRNWKKGQFYTDLFRKTAIEYVERMGANSICVVFNTYQSTTATSDIDFTPAGGKYWTDYQEVYDYCKFLKEKGYKIMLKPHVEPLSNARDTSQTGYIPRDLIRPDDIASWFANYKTWLMPYVQMAEELHIEVFSIGCEYKGLTELQDPDTLVSKDYTSYWIELIKSIRNEYGGLLTYSAYYTTNYWEEAHWITFWDKLDLIGFDYYVNSSKESLVTQDDYRSSIYDAPDHSNCVLSVEMLQEKFKKPVIFTEFGNACSSTITYNMQNNWLNSVLEVFSKKEYMKGCFWWAFEYDQFMTDNELPSANNNLFESFNKYYKVIGNGKEKNVGSFVTFKNDSYDSGKWFKFAEFNLLKNYASSSYNFYFEDLRVNQSPAKGNVHIKFGSTNGTTYDYVYMYVDSTCNLSETNFGYIINGSTVALYVKLPRYSQYLYKLVSSDSKEDNLNIFLFNKYNQFASDSVSPVLATADKFYTASQMQVDGNTPKFPNGITLLNVAYEGAMTNGLLDITITLPINITYKPFMTANVKNVNSGRPSDINAEVKDLGNNQIQLSARHYSGSGTWYAQYQIFIMGK